jgi:hypothetical protein
MSLIFVYNSKSDKLNTIIDYAHKVIKPSAYNCDLCILTHSNFGEKKEWSNFKDNLNLGIEFYHIDEFEKKFTQAFNYPIILNGELKILLDSEAINNLKDVTELIQKIKELI